MKKIIALSLLALTLSTAVHADDLPSLDQINGAVSKVNNMTKEQKEANQAKIEKIRKDVHDSEVANGVIYESHTTFSDSNGTSCTTDSDEGGSFTSCYNANTGDTYSYSASY